MARLSSTCLLLASCLTTVLGAVQVAPPAAPPGDNVTTVFSNFFGISLELSFINYYFGNDTTSIPQPVLNYLGAMHSRSADRPVKLRLGGNSMDSSTYVPDQQEIIKFTNPDANVNDQPVSYGAELFKIMKTASDSVGGVEWLIGLSLRNPNDTNIPLVAGDAQKYLGDNLDAYLVGNEPDLYTTHGNRPNLKNYTVNDYIGDYWVTLLNLNNTPTDGSVLNTDKIAGPTICCFWDLDGVLTSGWLDQFRQYLKYITLQHYPQNNCFGHYDFHLDYYMSHTQAVHLAQWQGAGLQRMASLPADQRKPVLMDEFNSASCGGIPQSNMFGIALWTADYALQMAAVGYSGAYIHTRERGVTYNLFDPPAGVAGSEGVWTTNANFYAVLAVTEALQNTKGSRVVDLNVNNSVTDYAAINAGYAIYDASSSNVHALVLFNYANASAQATDYTIPANMFSGAADSGNVLVRYLVAPTATETTNVTWGNLTYAGVADGRLVEAQTAWPDKTYSCAQGCTVQVPGPGMAVVFVGGQPQVSANSSNSSSSGGSGGKTAGTKPDDNAAIALDARGFWVGAAGVVALAFAALA